jgi:hypothetical protein
MNLSLSFVNTPRGNGLSIPAETNLKDWTQLMHGLAQVKAQYHSCLGDAIRFGRKKFVSDADDVIEQMELPFDDVQRAESAALAPASKRTLPAEIYHVANKEAKEDVDRDQWLEKAKKEGLSARELQHSMRMGRVIRQGEIDSLNGKDSAIPTLRPVGTGFERWFRSVGGTAAIAQLPEENKASILLQLQPIYDLCWGIDPELADED